MPVCLRTVSEGLGTSTRGQFLRRVETDVPALFGGELQQRRFVGLQVDAGDGVDIVEAGLAESQRLIDGRFDRGERRVAVATEAERSS